MVGIRNILKSYTSLTLKVLVIFFGGKYLVKVLLEIKLFKVKESTIMVNKDLYFKVLGYLNNGLFMVDNI